MFGVAILVFVVLALWWALGFEPPTGLSFCFLCSSSSQFFDWGNHSEGSRGWEVLDDDVVVLGHRSCNPPVSQSR